MLLHYYVTVVYDIMEPLMEWGEIAAISRYCLIVLLWLGIKKKKDYTTLTCSISMCVCQNRHLADPCILKLYIFTSNFSQKDCFLGLEWVKWNFTAFGSPAKVFLATPRIHYWPLPRKNPSVVHVYRLCYLFGTLKMIWPLEPNMDFAPRSGVSLSFWAFLLKMSFLGFKCMVVI